MIVRTGRVPGRSHRDRGVPCQDAWAVRRLDHVPRLVAAVADGLGSRPLSHLGSKTAAEAAAGSLAAAKRWGPAAIRRAFLVARNALETRARHEGVPLGALATTLQVVGIEPGRLVAGMVGDGAILVTEPSARILLAPEDSGYANHVAPLSDPGWEAHLRYATAAAAHETLLLTDGLTRLLLERRKGQWTPYAPFFDAFLPHVRDAAASQDVIARFLSDPATDQAWDDDKCMVVIGLDAHSR